MQAFDFGNKLTIHWNKIVLLVLLAGLPFISNGQRFRWSRQHNPNYDSRVISYGFMIGVHTSGYQVTYADEFVTPQYDTVSSVMAEFSPGFSLGFLVNYRVNEFLDLRIMPKAGFYTHKLRYTYTDESTDVQFVESTHVELPFLLKYKSMRRGNVRMYMIGGITPGLELSGKNEIKTSGLDIRKANVQLEGGLGFDFYFPLFKFSQEIRFARGIMNVLGEDSSIYSDPLKRLNTNTISVYFIFQ
jgi:hypothetical protein